MLIDMLVAPILFHYKIKIERDIGIILNNLGYSSFYKAHPSRLKELGEAIKNYYDFF